MEGLGCEESTPPFATPGDPSVSVLGPVSTQSRMSRWMTCKPAGEVATSALELRRRDGAYE
jgi:hypothetical protein